jgi:hypothetical protein
MNDEGPWDNTIRAERAITKARAITVGCRYCGAVADESCFNPINGEPYERMAAHLYRLQDSGAM